MSKAIQTIQLGTHEFQYRGKTRTASVVAYVYLDECFSIDWDMPADEKATLERDLERGNITPCGIEVRARCYEIPGTVGIDGVDSCWGFLIKTPTDINEAIADHGMIQNAIAELVRELDDAIVAARNLIAELGEVQS